LGDIFEVFLYILSEEERRESLPLMIY